MATSTMQNSNDSLKGNPAKKAVRSKIVKASTAVKRKSKPKVAEALSAQIYRKGRDAASSVYDSASKAGARASRAMPDLRSNLHVRERSQSLYASMEEHPFVMGAVGLGVGMVLAALMPSANTTRHKR
jgi:hypothetical protein